MKKQINNTCRIKPIYAYFKDSIKFYDTQNAFVAQIIFILQLAVVFGGFLLLSPYAEDSINTFQQFSELIQEQLAAGTFDLSLSESSVFQNLLDSVSGVVLLSLALNAVSFIISLFYLAYYYLSLVRPSTGMSERLLLFFRRLPKLIFFNILFYILFLIAIAIVILISALIVMYIPFFAMVVSLLPLLVIITYIMFIFKDLLIIEFDVGIIKNFKASLDVTRNCKKNIFFNSLWPIIVSWIIASFAAGVQNWMLSVFISSFFEVIIIMASSRLTVLMFIDAAGLERQDKKGVTNEKIEEDKPE